MGKILHDLKFLKNTHRAIILRISVSSVMQDFVDPPYELLALGGVVFLFP